MAGLNVLGTLVARVGRGTQLYGRRCVVDVVRQISQGDSGSSQPPKPKRPLNSFVRFTNEIRKDTLGLSSRQQIALAGQKWKVLTEEQKAAYKPSTADIQAYNEDLTKWRESLTEDERLSLQEAAKKRRKALAKFRLKKKQKELQMPSRPAISGYMCYVKSMPMERENVPITMFIKELAQQWRNMAEDHREPYKVQAREAKEKYFEELEKWEEKMIKEKHFDVVRQSSLPAYIDKQTGKPKKVKAVKSKKKKSTTTKKAKKKSAEEEDHSWMRDE